MNLHVPRSLESEAELRTLSATTSKIILAQTSLPGTYPVMDAILGCYKMTLGTRPITKDQFFHIAMRTNLSSQEILRKIQHIRRVLKNNGKKARCFNGKGIISLLLPDDFLYEKQNKVDPNEPIVKIYKGVLLSGTLNKSDIGNSIISLLAKEYKNEVVCDFIDNIQFVTNEWLLIDGFSISIRDCLPKKEKTKEIEDIVHKCFIKAEYIKNSVKNPSICEFKINSALNEARDISFKISKETLETDNNFISTVTSGSKGDFFNIMQISCLLAQQNINGNRVKQTLNNNTRTLYHYPHEIKDYNMIYESRGFIKSSFVNGLKPKELFFHSMCGRTGIIDTSLNTSVSGYIQRKLIKINEDIKICYDNTVRDPIGLIYQYSYNDNMYDPIKTKNNEFCDINRLVNRLNLKYE